MNNRVIWWFIGLSVLVATAFVTNLLTGPAKITISEIFHLLSGAENETVESIIFFQLRLPKAISAILVGAGLSVAGLLMQGLFRNPLAGPYVLGVSSGASLMVALVMMAGTLLSVNILGSPWIIAAAAMLGAVGVLLLVLLIAIRVNDSVSLLVIGIMIAGLASSIVSLLQFFTSPEILQQFIVWTFGSLSNIGYNQLSLLAPIIIIGILLSLLIQKQLNSFLLGDNYASVLGVSIKNTRTIIILLTGIMAGIITAFAGPIVFIGVAVPHLTRSLFNSLNHKILIPASALIGAILMLVCDIASQLPNLSNALPINAVTSLLGAPVIIWIVLKNKRLTSANF